MQKALRFSFFTSKHRNIIYAHLTQNNNQIMLRKKAKEKKKFQ